MDYNRLFFKVITLVNTNKVTQGIIVKKNIQQPTSFHTQSYLSFVEKSQRLLLAFFIFFIYQTSKADEIFNSEKCFCLINNEDQIWYDCVIQTTLNDKFTMCKSDLENHREKINEPQFKQLSEGTGLCQPCSLKSPPAQSGIRGENDKQ
ncbi:hypothetical protein MAH1_03330 [Sessilibacter sp. MAH1]